MRGIQAPSAPEAASDATLASFGGVLLAYAAGMAALATLAPFDFQPANPRPFAFVTSASDLALNLLLLFPAGFLHRLVRRGRSDARCLDTLALGLLFSLSLETLQRFLPSRCATPIDVLANGLGAWAGAYTHALLGPWLDRVLAHKLALELPLAHALYLLALLSGLTSLARATLGPVHPWLAAPLLGFVAAVAAALYVQRFHATGRGPWRFSAAFALVFSLSLVPFGLRQPGLTLLESAGLLFATRAFIAWPLRLPAGERRIEVKAMLRASPLFALYLGALAFWFSPALVWGTPRLSAFVLLVVVAAFTVLGYVSGQLHARSRVGSGAVVLRSALLAALAALLFVVRPELSLWPTSGAFVLLCLAAAFGAAIHRCQLAFVQATGAHMHARSSGQFAIVAAAARNI